MKRREFLDFLGRGALIAGLAPGALLNACGSLPTAKNTLNLGFTPIGPTSDDKLLLAPEFQYDLLISKGDSIGPQLQWGACNDFNAFFPFQKNNPYDGMLWTNHECPEPFLTTEVKSKQQILAEMETVGGSLVRFFRDRDGSWKIDPTDARNRRFNANTPIPFIAPRSIQGANVAAGTLANCAGGKTPWGTVLTCEENYHQYFGEWEFNPGQSKQNKMPRAFYKKEENLGWSRHFERSPWHYGWVVEINPFTGKAKKLTALGRFLHEGATCVQASDGRTVVYMGDDKVDRYLYKFIPDRKNSLDTGTLYVACLEKNRWLPLVMGAHPGFKETFRDQLDLLIHTSYASEMLGATPLDRPEDIERDPATGDIIVVLTNNNNKGRPHGSLLRLSEDPLAMEFEWKTWIAGGPDAGISCPDNLAFDAKGNLWIASDMGRSEMLSGALRPFRNNGLYCVPMSGPNAGNIFQAASAPVGAEFTGPEFLPDGTLLVSVQHPGDFMAPEIPKVRTSSWPSRPGGEPRSSLIAIKM